MKFQCLIPGCGKHVEHTDVAAHTSEHTEALLLRARQALSDLSLELRVKLLNGYCTKCGRMKLNDRCPECNPRDEMCPDGHLNCRVVYVQGSQPKVCMCECKDCKRAWFDKGQPVIRGEQVIYR